MDEILNKPNPQLSEKWKADYSDVGLTLFAGLAALTFSPVLGLFIGLAEGGKMALKIKTARDNRKFNPVLNKAIDDTKNLVRESLKRNR